MYRKVSGKLTVGRALRIFRFAVSVPVTRLRQQGLRGVLIWAFVRARLFFTGVSSQRYSRVLPELYVGGQIRRRGWDRLRQAGVTSVVNMRREHDDRAAGLDIPAERYLHLPTLDDAPVSLEDLHRGADWIAGQIAEGGVVYIHCAAGSGRAPSMGAAYLIKHRIMTTDEALATIAKVRPFIMPRPEQLARLREFESDVRGS